MNKLIYCSITLWALCSIVATEEIIDVQLREIKEKLSPQEINAIESLGKEWANVQNGDMNFPVDELVVSLGLAKYIVKEKIVDVKKYQDGKADIREFVKEFMPHYDVLAKVLRALYSMTKIKPSDEAKASESTTKWIHNVKYLKKFIDSCHDREEEAFYIMKTLPLE